MPKERLDAGLAYLRDRYDVVIDGAGVLANSGFLAGDDDRRADELNRYLRDPDIRAIIMARGGYGLTRILPHLDADALRSDPTLLIGFSDGTALLGWALTQAGVRGIHGPVVAQLGELGFKDWQWLHRLMESTEPVGTLASGLDWVGQGDKESIRGPLRGGNLCLLSHLVGTDYFPDMSGAIFFAEDVGERPYAIDRYLTHLAMGADLGGAAGALIGELVRCEETVCDPDPSAAAVVEERLSALGLSGVIGAPFGHGSVNRALPYDGACEIDRSTGAVVLLEAAVA